METHAMRNQRTLLLSMYEAMLSALGPSRWWPAETPFEVAVGAILTQNTNWDNVKRAIDNLKRDQLLTPEALYALPEAELAERIRPAGYYRLKAGRLRNFLTFLAKECGFSLDRLAQRDMDQARRMLLGVCGVGPETADSILLYALHLPSFVADAYTLRIAARHGLISEDAGYEEVREFFMDHLPEDLRLYNEFHALIVRTGAEWCRKKAGRCEECPLRGFLS